MQDALSVLEELIQTNPQLIDSSLAIIIQATARQIGDEDINIRRTTLSFLRCILNIAPSTSLRPHANTLLLFTASALSHIFPEIRIDASKVLDLLIDYFPTDVVEGWNIDSVTFASKGCGPRILQSLLALLHASPRDGIEQGLN